MGRSLKNLIVYLSGIGVFLFSVLYESARGVVFAAAFIGIIFISRLFGMTRKERKILDIDKRARLSLRSSVGILGLSVILLLGGCYLVSVWEEEWIQTAYRIEGAIYRLSRQISGTADEAVSDGIISRGNNYRTGTVQLELGTMDKPTESIYLRGFSGGDYKNSEWKAADDDALLRNVVETLRWQQWLEMVRGMYYSMYFLLSTDLSEHIDPDIRLLSVHPVGEDFHTFYMPYCSRWSRWNGNPQERSGLEYYFEYYQQEDVSIDWEEQQVYLTEAAGWYKELQTEYQKEAEEAYTSVPRQDIPRLDRLVAENPLEELDEITAFILTTLTEHAAYTLTPGRIPVNQETVEYFLFESGEGYCQHFASAATLMYRMYGIPARYAAGYRVDPEDFTEQEDGSWNAWVTDESAHAWVEIFLEDYGWTPVEVTPSADGTITASYPGLDTESFSELLRDMGDGFSVPARMETVRATEDGQAEDQSHDNGWTIPDLSEHRDAFYVVGILFVYLLPLLPVFLNSRSLCKRRRLEAAGCCTVYVRWLEMLHFCGLLQEYHGLEDDFPAAAGDISGIGYEDIVKMQEIVREGTFSPRTPGIEEERFVTEHYFRSALFLKKQQKRIRKLLFSYYFCELL